MNQYTMRLYTRRRLKAKYPDQPMKRRALYNAVMWGYNQAKAITKENRC